MLPLERAARSFAAGRRRLWKRFGSHSVRLQRRLTPMSRMAAPKTVLTPGIETGTKKTRVRKATSSRRPSWPTRSLISPSVTSSDGRFLMMISSCSPSEFVLTSASWPVIMPLTTLLRMSCEGPPISYQYAMPRRQGRFLRAPAPEPPPIRRAQIGPPRTTLPPPPSQPAQYPQPALLLHGSNDQGEPPLNDAHQTIRAL